MPWIDENGCTGCRVCVEECPADTIYMKNEKAEIDMGGCIRCGTCHEVCPEDAVRHDSEKIPEEVDANIAKATDCMNACAKHFGDDKEKQKCLIRMIKYFNKEKSVVEKTLERLQSLKAELGV
jgi:formate hydrogenlyase subunit 6/NADH:ubiquinone oxidoreductase subunit I